MGCGAGALPLRALPPRRHPLTVPDHSISPPLRASYYCLGPLNPLSSRLAEDRTLSAPITALVRLRARAAPCFASLVDCSAFTFGVGRASTSCDPLPTRGCACGGSQPWRPPAHIHLCSPAIRDPWKARCTLTGRPNVRSPPTLLPPIHCPPAPAPLNALCAGSSRGTKNGRAPCTPPSPRG